MKDVMNVLESVELSQMVRSVAMGIADAQMSLDLQALRAFETFANTELAIAGEKANLLELGLAPNFYQLAETTLQMKVSISMTEEQVEEKKTHDEKSKSEAKAELSVSVGWFSASATATTTTTTTTSSVDARFASRFQYSAEGSSSLSTRIVPVPPPAVLMQIARRAAKE